MAPARPWTAALALSVLALAAACGHGGAAPSVAPEPAAAPPLATPAEPAPEPAPAPAPAPVASAQVITFGEDEPDSEPTQHIRSAPKREPIPAFQLFGTRKGDGP